MLRIALMTCLLAAIHAPSQAGDPPRVLRCDFDKEALSFAGSPIEQARCLLRKVGEGANIPPLTVALPPPFEALIDQPVAIDRSKFRTYLQGLNTSEASIGGSLDQPLSRGRDNDPKAPFARYFVIHDTSLPLPCLDLAFPADVDEPTWSGNKLSRYATSKQAHLYITRDGQSIAAGGRTFKDAWRATQAEMPDADTRAKGMFLHVENVQPRLVEPDLKQDATLKPNRQHHKWSQKENTWVCLNDARAPDPGLSARQMDRLALIYIAASVRRGQWMVPAFHAVMDLHVKGGHDDPQNFDLVDWGARICTQLEAIGGSCPVVQK